MDRTAIIYYHGTFVHRQNGAHARVAELIQFVQASGWRTIVYSYREHPSCPWDEPAIARFAADFPGVELVLDRRGRRLRLAERAKQRLIALFPRLATRLIARRIPGATPHYDRLCARYPAAALLVNYALGLTQLNGVDATRAIVETHDLSFLNAARSLHRRVTAAKTMLSARLELELLDHAAGLIAIALPEASVFRLFYTDKPVFFIPAYALPTLTLAQETHRYDLLFVGSENILNVEGLCGFIADHRDQLARWRLAVVGRVCDDPRVRAAARGLPGVDLLGYVDDLIGLTRECKLAISPVEGTGLKIKVRDALFLGKPVFGSPGTLAGLPTGYEACVFPIDGAAIQAMLDDDTRRAAAEREAIAYARDRLLTSDVAGLRTLVEAIQDRPINPAWPAAPQRSRVAAKRTLE